jgi:hypothetical protein
MSKNLTCSRGPLELETGGEIDLPRGSVLQLNTDEIITKELALARKSYPTLCANDQRTWLIWGHRHHMNVFSQGHFTIRLIEDKGPSVFQSMAKGRTHGLFTVADRKRADESSEMILFLFLVDLRKAMLNRHLANSKFSKPEYLLFDVMEPGVEKFCERLKV